MAKIKRQNLSTGQQNWQSSWAVFKEAGDLALNAWPSLLLFIGGQIILYWFLSWYQSMLAVWGLTDISSIEQLVIQTIIVLVFFLYQILYTVAVIRMLEAGNQVISKDLFFKWPVVVVLILLMTIVITVATVFLVVPGIILNVFWSLAVFALVLEDFSVKHALQRSVQLVRGYWWSVFLRMVFIFFVGAFVAVFAVVPEVGAKVSLVLSLLLAPVVILYFGVTYKELNGLKTKNPDATMPVSFLKKVLISLGFLLAVSCFIIFTYSGDFVISISEDQTLDRDALLRNVE